MDISAPATQVVVHAHSNDKEILICVEINTGEGVEVRIAEYDVALGSSQPDAGVVRHEDRGRIKQRGGRLTATSCVKRQRQHDGRGRQ